MKTLISLSLLTLITLISYTTSQIVELSDDKNCPFARPCITRTYFIQAEEVEWDYAPSGMDHVTNKPLRDSDAHIWTMRYKNRIGAIYMKAQYIGYTDDTFTVRTPQPVHLGIQGPVIRAQVFRNMCELEYGIHSHGVKYVKQDEGASYGNHNVMSSSIAKAKTHTYTWVANERAGPGPSDGNSTLWAYHSHNDDQLDMYAGLVGSIVIYRQGILSPVTHLPTDVDQEFFLHFLVFNENLSPYLRDNILTYAPELSDRLLKNPATPFKLGGDTWQESNLQHAINGRMYGNLDGLTMRVGDRVRWHVIGFGTEVDIHSVHWHSQTLLYNGHRRDVIELMPATFRSLEMVIDTDGTWMLHCHVLDHQIGGMAVLYTVLKADEVDASSVKSFVAIEAPKSDMNVRPAPRPPMAEPLLSINNAVALRGGVAVVALIAVLVL